MTTLSKESLSSFNDLKKLEYLINNSTTMPHSNNDKEKNLLHKVCIYMVCMILGIIILIIATINLLTNLEAINYIAANPSFFDIFSSVPFNILGLVAGIVFTLISTNMLTKMLKTLK